MGGGAPRALVRLLVLSTARPFTPEKFSTVFLPGAVSPCTRCRSFAAARASGSSAAAIATASDKVKSLRWTFSAYSRARSPPTSGWTPLPARFPSRVARRRADGARQRQARRWPSRRWAPACAISPILRTSGAMSPNSRRNRLPILMSAIGITGWRSTSFIIAGFLPAVPKGRPAARPASARAAGMSGPSRSAAPDPARWFR